MQGRPPASDDDRPEGEKSMKLDKEKFLKTKFGGELECMITAWDQALGKNRRTGENKEILKTLAWCQAQWEVYRMAIKHFYGVEYHFTRTEKYYGLCTGDASDWLMKVDRGLVKQKKPIAGNEMDIDSVVKSIISGIERNLQVSAGIFSSQRVTRKGINIDGVEYWDDDFVHLNLGRTVIIETSPYLIRVYNRIGTPLRIFHR